MMKIFRASPITKELVTEVFFHWLIFLIVNSNAKQESKAGPTQHHPFKSAKIMTKLGWL